MKEIDPGDTVIVASPVLGELGDLPAAQAYLSDNLARWIAEQRNKHPGGAS